MDPFAIIALAITGILVISATVAGISGAVKARRERRQPVQAAPRPRVRIVRRGSELPDEPAPAAAPRPPVRLGATRPFPRVRPQPLTPIRRSTLRLPVRVKPLWEEKGWQRQGNVYTGVFRAKGQEWPGRIESPYRGNYVATIWNPPVDELHRRDHAQQHCFQSLGGNGRYNVHWHQTPRHLDHAITCIEQILRDVS